MLLVYALTLFLSATLLFLVQLIIAKMILPKFGGTPAVWNTSMVFFQAWLLAGYSYAYFAPAWLGTRRQVLIHIGLLLLPFIVLPIAVSESYVPPADAFPVPYLLALLLVTVGLPFFMVSTSAPLLQKWYAHTGDRWSKDPYFLYAASNIGSMVALLGYPPFVEPYFPLRTQGWAWTVGYAVLVAVTGACAWLFWKSPGWALADGAPAAPPPRTEPETAVIAGPLDGPGEPAASPSAEENSTAVTARKLKGKRKQRSGPSAAKVTSTAMTAKRPEPRREVVEDETDVRPETVSWAQRLNWVALAFVPSSLFLGVTTYLTTDIAAIPLLWVIPLAIYLLSFILVFSTYGRTFLVAILGGILLLAALAGLSFQSDTSVLLGLVLVLMLLAGGGLLVVGVMWGRSDLLGNAPPFSFLHKGKAEQAGHMALVLLMPVAILMLVFMIMSELGPEDTVKRIMTLSALHLATLFVVAMVCHGELARTRPPMRYLTEFYLLMSFGGVLGGMFNALAAPLVFNRIAEYEIAMVIACLVMPTLGVAKKNQWARVLDIGLPGVLALLAVGLIVRRWIEGYYLLGRENELRQERDLPLIDAGFMAPVNNFFRDIGQLMVTQPMWKWSLLAIVLAALGYLLWAILMDVVFGKKGQLLDRALDIGVALSLTVLAAGIMLRSPLNKDSFPVTWLVDRLGVPPSRVIMIITYGLPALFCYIFVERPVRFGFCLAAFLLAGSLTSDLSEQEGGDRVLYRARSFFGSIAVREKGGYHRLNHGTTLHGKQYFNSDAEMTWAFVSPLMASNPLEATVNNNVGMWMWGQRHEALTYYHRDGPIGQVMTELEQRKPLPHLAVIGLGTGTMASYAKPGQQLTYYEIDPTVKRIAEDRNLFTYISDARDRGVKLEIEMGDARLQLKHAPEHEYGLIVVDAFSSDAIPTHLITKEAIELYLEKLADNGILAFHISNRYLNLEPVLVNLGNEFGLAVLGQSDDKEDAIGKSGSHWVILARNQEAFGRLNKEIKLWPRDHAHRWKDLIHKQKADQLSDKELEPWKEQYFRRQEGAERAGGKAFEDARERSMKMTPAEAKRLMQIEIDEQWDKNEAFNQRVGVWTDDFSNIFRVFNFGD